STDYDISDRLYFEPLTFEDVLEVYHAELAVGPVAGVIVQLGGQTPLSLAQRLAGAGGPIVGTPPEGLDAAGDRGNFVGLLARPPPRHLDHPRAGRGGRRPGRPPGDRAPPLRARWARPGDRLRRRPAARLRPAHRYRGDHRPAPHRPLPRRRHRDRRRRHLRR